MNNSGGVNNSGGDVVGHPVLTGTGGKNGLMTIAMTNAMINTDCILGRLN